MQWKKYKEIKANNSFVFPKRKGKRKISSPRIVSTKASKFKRAHLLKEIDMQKIP